MTVSELKDLIVRMLQSIDDIDKLRKIYTVIKHL